MKLLSLSHAYYSMIINITVARIYPHFVMTTRQLPKSN